MNLKISLILFFVFSISVLNYCQQWEIAGEMLEPVYGAEALVVDSSIYIIGGFSESENSEVNYIQKFDPGTDNWEIISNLNFNRYGLIAEVFNDSIFILGGIPLLNTGSNASEMWNKMDPPYNFDSKENFTRSFAVSEMNNNKIYVFGGNSTSLFSNFMFEYNLNAKQITFENNFDFPAVYPSQQSSAIFENEIFLFGGVTIGVSNSIYRFNTNQKSFETLEVELNTNRAGACAIKINNEEVYLIGGFNESQSILSSVEIFKIENENYSTLEGPEINYARREAMAVLFNNSIYLFGGKNENDLPVATIEKLDVVTGIKDIDEPVTEFKLYQNYPNPFNPSTKIKFSIPANINNDAGFVTLKIYDILGKEIATLINEKKQPGSYEVDFNSNVNSTLQLKGSNLSSGIYFYRLSVTSGNSNYVQTKKMVLAK